MIFSFPSHYTHRRIPQIAPKIKTITSSSELVIFKKPAKFAAMKITTFAFRPIIGFVLLASQLPNIDPGIVEMSTIRNTIPIFVPLILTTSFMNVIDTVVKELTAVARREKISK